jgi:hypothetical protein
VVGYDPPDRKKKQFAGKNASGTFHKHSELHNMKTTILLQIDNDNDEGKQVNRAFLLNTNTAWFLLFSKLSVAVQHKRLPHHLTRTEERTSVFRRQHRES